MIELVGEAAWQPGTWAHGTTQAIAAWTDAAGAITARLSVASIDRGGSFSSFVGCDRWLAVLDDGGGLRLDRGGTPHPLATGATLQFGGDEPIVATPTRPARVFNLIVRRGLAWQARIVTALDDHEAPPGVVAIFATAATLAVELADRPHALARHVTAIATSRTPLRVRVEAAPTRPAIVVQLAGGPDRRRAVTVPAITVQDTARGSP